MWLKAAPRMTPTARSMTLPRAMNSRNSPRIGTRRSSSRGTWASWATSLGTRTMGRANPLFVGGVEPLAQLLAALEERHVLGAHVDRLAGARVAPGAGVARAHRQRAEAAQLDPT